MLFFYFCFVFNEYVSYILPLYSQCKSLLQDTRPMLMCNGIIIMSIVSRNVIILVELTFKFLLTYHFQMKIVVFYTDNVLHFQLYIV